MLRTDMYSATKFIMVLVALVLLFLSPAILISAANQGTGGGGQMGPSGPVGDNPLQHSIIRQIRGDYVAAGVGMRGTGAGIITISGIPARATVRDAFLYWAIIGGSTDPEPSLFEGVFNGIPVSGELIGADTDPCWDPAVATFAFRANVTSLVTGNGTYALSGFASGIPFTPLNEGASLIVIYHVRGGIARRNVVISDGADTLDGSVQEVSTVMRVPPIGPLGFAKTTYIVADGQDIFPDSTVFNGTIIATDPPELGSTESFEGSDGPLWDTDTYDVTALVSAGDTVITAGISTPPFHDCLVHVAQVFSSPVQGQ